MSLSILELLHGHVITDLTIAQQHCLEDLQTKINMIREAWGKPMMVTSGFRTPQDQARINPKVTRSAHMEAKAVDILDEGLELTKWLKETPEGQQALEDADLYCEDGNANWLHAQTRPFGSYKPGGTRWFLP